MKSLRHKKILEIIAAKDIETQEELTALLKEEGFPVTQATVSRDIKALRLIKIATRGKSDCETHYKYSVNAAREEMDSVLSAKFKAILCEAMMKIDCAGNLVVMKTYAGMAQASAAAIDAMNISNIVGTIAGDDTLLIIMRTLDEAEEFTKQLSALRK